LGHRAAVVGPEGHGKSRLLTELTRRLEAAGWRVRRARVEDRARRLPRAVEQALLAGLGPGDLVVLDGADALAPWAWLRLRWGARHAGGLLITRHGPGPLPELHRCTTSPALLGELIAELLVEPQGLELSGLELPSAEELFERHAGNLREALFELYDRCARPRSRA
jgi:hypothetical protein